MLSPAQEQMRVMFEKCFDVMEDLDNVCHFLPSGLDYLG